MIHMTWSSHFILVIFVSLFLCHTVFIGRMVVLMLIEIRFPAGSWPSWTAEGGASGWHEAANYTSLSSALLRVRLWASGVERTLDLLPMAPLHWFLFSSFLASGAVGCLMAVNTWRPATGVSQYCDTLLWALRVPPALHFLQAGYSWFNAFSLNLDIVICIEDFIVGCLFLVASVSY